MISTGDVSPLLFAAWLRWHGLEFGFADEIAPEDGYYHSHSGGPALHKVLRCLTIPEGSVALDLGVGMGIAAITLSHHFHRVVGVDLSPRLIEAAQRNFRRVSITNVELICADARALEHELDAVTHIYMFNPFPASVMSHVLTNIKQSLLRAPRRLTIIYKLPVFHTTILEHGFTQVRHFHLPHTHPVAIYHAQTS